MSSCYRDERLNVILAMVVLTVVFNVKTKNTSKSRLTSTQVGPPPPNRGDSTHFKLARVNIPTSFHVSYKRTNTKNLTPVNES